MLASADAAVVEVPDLRALILRVPAAEVVAEGEDPLLRAGALLITPGAADHRVEAMLVDRVQQRHRLQPVARRPRTRLLDRAAGVDRILHVGDDEALAELGHAAIAELDHLREVVPGVDVHQDQREAGGAKRLLGESQEHDRVLAAGEQDHRSLELGRDLAEHVDRLGLQCIEMRDGVSAVEG